MIKLLSFVGKKGKLGANGAAGAMIKNEQLNFKSL